MSLSVFDGKIFNAEVFKGYVDRLPNPKKNELIKCKAIRPRPDLAKAMAVVVTILLLLSEVLLTIVSHRIMMAVQTLNQTTQQHSSILVSLSAE